MSEVPGWITDSHTHLLPPRLAAKIRAFFEATIVPSSASEPTIGKRAPTHQGLSCCPPPEVFEGTWRKPEDLPRHAVTAIPHAVSDLTQLSASLRNIGVGSNWVLPYAHKADVALKLNSDILGICDELRHKHRLKAVAGFTVHPADGSEGVDRAARKAIADGARVAKLHCSVGAYSVLHPNLVPHWQLAERVGFPTVVHAGMHTSGQTLSTDLPTIEEVAIRFPRAKIILAHSGGPATKQGIEIAWRRKNVYLDTTPVVTVIPAYPTSVQQPHHDQLMTLARSGRVLFGTDLPNVVLELPEILQGVVSVFDETGRFGTHSIPQSANEAGAEGSALWEVLHGAAERLVRQVQPDGARL